jgi:hypothetical protein
VKEKALTLPIPTYAGTGPFPLPRGGEGETAKRATGEGLTCVTGGTA